MIEWDAFPAVARGPASAAPAAAPGASEWDAFPVAPPLGVAPVAAPSVGFDRNDPRFSEGAMASGAALEGVPILGAGVQKASAYLSALAHPLTGVGSEGATIAERAAKNLEQEKVAKAAFEQEHPIENVASNLVGGTLALVPLGATGIGAKALGLVGETLPAQMAAGAASGAALGGADAAARGEDIGSAARTNALFGAVGPVAGRAVGKVVDAVRGIKDPPAFPQNVTDIAGAPVRQSLGQATSDTEAIAREQMALRGADNSREAAVARDFFDAQKDELGNASRAVASRMSPTGEVLAESPQDAAAILLDSLGQRGQAQAQEAANHGQALATALRPGLPSAPADPLDAANVIAGHIGQARAVEAQQAQQAAGQLAAQGEAVRRGLNGGGGVLASSPMEAANIVSGAVGKAAEDAQAAKTAAYAQLRELPGQFHPAAFNNVGNDIRGALNRGENPVRIDPQRTPSANAALSDLDEMLGSLRQQRDENGRILPKPPTTPQVVETARQRLNTFLSDAIQSGRSTGNWADARAMGEIIDEFDNQVGRRLQRGTFIGGDPQGVRDAMQNARALNTTYRRTFTPQGAGDQVGQAIQKIVGRYEGQASPPEEITGMLYGKGALPVKIAQRLVGMFGADSPEIGAIKQGLFAHLTETPGLGRLPPAEAADRIDQFLSNSTLPHIYLRPQERRALSTYAQSLRGSVPAAPAATDQISRLLPRITGEGGGQPMTAQEISDLIFGRGGAGENPTGVKLAEHIRDTQGAQSPAFAAIKQGLFSKLHGADSAETASNIKEFLNGRGKPMAQAVFVPQEQAALQAYGNAHAEQATRLAAPTTQVDKIMARLTGADGHAPPTTSDVVQYLNTTKGVSRPVQLVQRLKSDFGEGSREFSALKQGQWAYLNGNKAGPLDVGSKAVVSRIKEFLDGSGKPLAHAMYTPDERNLMRAYGNLMERITPPPGTVNYSNTASVLGKMFRGTMDGLFAAGGVSMAGPVGVAAGLAAHQGQKIIQDAVKASKVARSLYGTAQSNAAFADLQIKLVRLAAFTSRVPTTQNQRAANQ